jgi:hypothetical protein
MLVRVAARIRFARLSTAPECRACRVNRLDNIQDERAGCNYHGNLVLG